MNKIKEKDFDELFNIFAHEVKMFNSNDPENNILANLRIKGYIEKSLAEQANDFINDGIQRNRFETMENSEIIMWLCTARDKYEKALEESKESGNE